MSDFTAIAGVSRTLRSLLQARMEDPPDHVTIAPPDVTVDNTNTGDRLNLYLYQVNENSYLKNQEIPGHGHPAAFGHPPLSLDLYYLLTAYDESDTTEDADLDAQQLLGDAMRVLHDFAIITEGRIGPGIVDPSLQGDFEQIKITLEPMTLEDFSKLWTALPEANFRRSVAYHVSVIQIESRQPRRYPRLVGEPPAAGPRVHVITFRSPEISELLVIRQDDLDREEIPYPYVRIGDTILLKGRNFTSDPAQISLGNEELEITDPRDYTRILVGDVEVENANITTLEHNRIEFILDNEALQPGPQTVRVILQVMMGEPDPTPHLGFHSNSAVFMLIPRVDTLIPDLASDPRTLEINGARLFDENLECMTLVGDTVIPSDDYTTSTATEIAFDLPAGLGSGNYVVRVRVNGTENIPEAILNVP